MRAKKLLIALLVGQLLVAAIALAEPPGVAYIFPAGGQRGTQVNVRVGGYFLHDRAPFAITGPGITAPAEIQRTETIWFEGPLIRQPASQAAEDYPQDYSAALMITADAPLGDRWWRCWNAQGVTNALRFVVGDLPEVVENETAGEPLPVQVSLPVTINGRVFPREDVDVWAFNVTAGAPVTCAVAAIEIGSPLSARLEVRDPEGRVIAENTGRFNADPRIQFVPVSSGRYSVRIHDVRFDGLQTHVYRLTLTTGPWLDSIYPLGGRRGTETKFSLNGQSLGAKEAAALLPDSTGLRSYFFPLPNGNLNSVSLDVDDLPEQREPEPSEANAPLVIASVPAVANGQIEVAGDVDAWTFPAKKGEPLRLEIRAARLGSPLNAVLAIRDDMGKELGRATDATVGPADCELTFTPPADGNFVAEVSERFATRGGVAFAYRLRIVPPSIGFRLECDTDALAVDAGGEKSIPVRVFRNAGFKEVVKLNVTGLPNGVTAAEVSVAPGADRGNIVFKAEASVPVQINSIQIVGSAEVAGQPFSTNAVPNVPFGHPGRDRLSLAVTLATPFKFRGNYDLRYTPCGTVLRKSFQLERNGFDGPLELRLADRQGRHLQGVTGPIITIPAAATEFEYPLFLPPWMELGRTSRTNLMATGEIKDAAGHSHKVCFTTREQNEQMVALVSPAPMRLGMQQAAYSAKPNSDLSVPVQIKRDRALSGPVRLELISPAHMRDITCEPVTTTDADSTATLHVRLAAAPGPFNMPLLIRATYNHAGNPIVAETNLELVAE